MTIRLLDGDHVESEYHCVEGKMKQGYPVDGACNILTRRYDGWVELLFHAVPATGAVLTKAQAREIADALYAAAGGAS